jgi:hypothetical protein
MKWIVETKGKDGAWKAFGYAQDEQAAREKAAKACLYAKLIHMVRFRRNLDD